MWMEAASIVLIGSSVLIVTKFLLALRVTQREDVLWVAHLNHLAKLEERVKLQKVIEEKEHEVLARRSVKEWKHKYCTICKHRQRSAEEIARHMLTCVQYGHMPTLSGRCDNCGVKVEPNDT